MSDNINNNEVISKIDDLANKMIKGLDSIEQRMATKDDLKGFATKGDLEDFATIVVKGFDHVQQQMVDLKTELKQGITEAKSEIKEDISESEAKLSRKIDQLDFKVEEVRDSVLTIEEVEVGDLQKRVGVLERASKHN